MEQPALERPADLAPEAVLRPRRVPGPEPLCLWQEVVVALSHLVVQYESNFCTVALQFIEEEKNYTVPSPATSTGGPAAGTGSSSSGTGSSSSSSG